MRLSGDMDNTLLGSRQASHRRGHMHDHDYDFTANDPMMAADQSWLRPVASLAKLNIDDDAPRGLLSLVAMANDLASDEEVDNSCDHNYARIARQSR